MVCQNVSHTYVKEAAGQEWLGSRGYEGVLSQLHFFCKLLGLPYRHPAKTPFHISETCKSCALM